MIIKDTILHFENARITILTNNEDWITELKVCDLEKVVTEDTVESKVLSEATVYLDDEEIEQLIIALKERIRSEE